MTEFICRPNATFNSAIDTQYPNDGFSHYLKVYDVTPDENSTYVRAYLTKYAWQYDGYAFNYSAVPTNAIINSVTVYGRFKGASDGSAKSKLRLSTTSYVHDLGPQISPTTSWADYHYTWSTNPFTSSAWQYSDLATLRMGIGLYSTDMGFAYCTQAWVVIDATVPGGGQVRFIGMMM